jgi:DNA ligase-1
MLYRAQLYKYSPKKGWLTWTISVENDLILTESGVLGGKMVTHESRVTRGKQGRDVQEQAVMEAKQKVVLQKRKQYSETQENVDDNTVPLPMLADSLFNTDGTERNMHRLTTKVFQQPKLDGIRCIAGVPGLFSRKGTPITGFDTLHNSVKNALAAAELTDDVWVDGELYSHDTSFEFVSSAVRGSNTSDKSNIKYWVYDIILPIPFGERSMILTKLFRDTPNVVVTPTLHVPKESIRQHHDEWVKQGYEGSIIRLDDATPYETDTRSKTLLKMKDFLDDEYEVIGFYPQRGNPDRLGSVRVKSLPTAENTIEFNATPSMTQEGKNNIWKHQGQYVGKIAAVRFFEKTSAGVPRFPVLIGFRDPNDM